MKNLTKIGLVSSAVLVVVACIIGFRYLTFSVDKVGDGKGIGVASAPSLDIVKAAQNLAVAIRFQTVSHQNSAENDVSQWTGLQSWLQSTYPNAHDAMQRELVSDRTLVYTWPGSDKKAQPIILMAHQDVVPVTPGTEKYWKNAPFSGAIVGQDVWGRGTVDDKGSLIALFEAVDALVKRGFKPKRSIIIVSGHDEEAGGLGAVAAAELLASRGVKALFTIDEGGIIAKDAPIINRQGALIGIAEKGYVTLKVTAKSQGGHSSMPPTETGVVNLAKAVIAINSNSFPLELKGPGVDMLNTLAAHKGGGSNAEWGGIAAHYNRTDHA
jgi:carboxypeptidase PM20D1